MNLQRVFSPVRIACNVEKQYSAQHMVNCARKIARMLKMIKKRLKCAKLCGTFSLCNNCLLGTALMKRDKAGGVK